MTVGDVSSASAAIGIAEASGGTLANPKPSTPSEIQASNVTLEVLKARMAEASGWITHIINTSALFAAIGIGLFKFALDANSTPQLRKVLVFAGITASFAGFLGCSLMERLRRDNVAEQKRLLLLLESELEPNPIRAVTYAVLSAAIAMVVNLVAWVYILVTTTP